MGNDEPVNEKELYSKMSCFSCCGDGMLEARVIVVFTTWWPFMTGFSGNCHAATTFR